ncbi:MAG: amidohydrolase [Planctomycetia bacterium]|nr:amidohydrolase [Planctomycetia bacterium]
MPRTILALALSCSLLVFASLRAESPRDWTKENLDKLVELYRHFHSHPELSLQEKETAARVAEELRAVGAEVTTDIGGHGLVGILKNGDGPTLMIRTDLDALPVTEKTELVYASEVKVKLEGGSETGVMHACGHDIHITSLIGTARFLAAHKDDWRGTVMFLGQPAEERGAGARSVLSDGLFTRFKKPDFALALHVDPKLATGKIGYRPGYALANVDSVDVTVRGKGGHGAYPHTTVDPIVLAAELILSLQAIVAREVDPTEPCVITVGAIQGGTTHNVIADTCNLKLTVRSYRDEVRRQLLDGIERRAKGLAAAAGAPEPVIKVTEGTPAMKNDEALVAKVLPALKTAVGEENAKLAEPQMGGEDFSEYGRAGVPIFMFRLGSVDARRLARYEQIGQEPPSLHSPIYYPDAEEALWTGVTAMSSAALHLLKK